MDDTTGPPRLTRLTFHGPLSEDRAARMIRRLTAQAGPTAPTTVLDIGCGWGEAAVLGQSQPQMPFLDDSGVRLHAEQRRVEKDHSEDRQGEPPGLK